MTAVDAVGDARDLGIGERGLEKIQLAGAGVTIAQGHAEDGAVVLGDDEGAVVARGEVGQVAVLVEDFGDDAHLLGKGEPGRAGLGPQ